MNRIYAEAFLLQYSAYTLIIIKYYVNIDFHIGELKKLKRRYSDI